LPAPATPRPRGQHLRPGHVLMAADAWAVHAGTGSCRGRGAREPGAAGKLGLISRRGLPVPAHKTKHGSGSAVMTIMTWSESACITSRSKC
jgi:hypothetical protein